jgi:hypothetical protein
MAARFYQLIWRSGLVANSLVADEWNLGESLIERVRDLGNAKAWPADAWVRSSSAEMDGNLDDFVVNNAMLPVITPRLWNLISNMETHGFSALPIEVRDSTGFGHKCYVLNTKTHIVRGVIIRKSNVISRHPQQTTPRAFAGRIMAAVQITLRESTIHGRHLFRCADYPGALFASGVFRTAFQSNGFTGATFSKVSCE